MFFSEKSLSRRWTCFQVPWCFIPNHSPSEWSVLLGILGCHNSTWRVFPQVSRSSKPEKPEKSWICLLFEWFDPMGFITMKKLPFWGDIFLCVFPNTKQSNLKKKLPVWHLLQNTFLWNFYFETLEFFQQKRNLREKENQWKIKRPSKTWWWCLFFSPRKLGKWSHFDGRIFFKWVVQPTNKKQIHKPPTRKFEGMYFLRLDCLILGKKTSQPPTRKNTTEEKAEEWTLALLLWLGFDLFGKVAIQRWCETGFVSV